MMAQGSFVVNNPAWRERLEPLLKGQHFMQLLGLKLTVIEPGYVEAEMEIQSVQRQALGFLHGGVTATICDIVAGVAAFNLIRSDQHVVTGEIKISYLNPGVGDKVKAIGRVIKQGRMISFCEADVYVEGNGNLVHVARASTSMVIIEESGAIKGQGPMDKG
jgi:uncharacterized protein (TIGR00369 family)